VSKDGKSFWVSFIQSNALFGVSDIILNSLMASDPFDAVDIFSGFELDSLFPIIHKYSMESMEKAIISRLETSEGAHNAASLIMVSQMVESDRLYEKAKDKLIQHTDHLKPEDASRIGWKAVYEVMLGRSNNKSTIQCRRHIPQCTSCRRNSTFQLKCNWCNRTETVSIG
jgi:hypothetical protein